MQQIKIAVIGSINMDLVTQSVHFPNVGETLLGTSFHQFMGGKGANQAVAAARLGATVQLIGAVGKDAFGCELLASLQREQVNVDAVKIIENTPTGIANITVAENDNHIIVVSGANFALTPANIEAEEQSIAESDIILSQLEIPLACVLTAAKLAKKHSKPFILNPAPAQKLPLELLNLVTLLTPNAYELAISLGLSQATPPESLIQQSPCQVVMTWGEKGALYNDSSNDLHHLPGYQVNPIDTTGAGDTFNAALAVFWHLGVAKAIRHANAAAALSITVLGAQNGMPSLTALQAFINQQT